MQITCTIRHIKVYETRSKHIMWWCNCCLYVADLTLCEFVADVGISSIYARAGFLTSSINLYVITRSWHAHHRVRLDELIWKNSNQLQDIRGQIYWGIDKTTWKSTVFTPLRFAEILLLLYVALSLAKVNALPPTPFSHPEKKWIKRCSLTPTGTFPQYLLDMLA